MARAEKRDRLPETGNGGNKTAGAKHIVANRLITEISGKLKPEGGSESDESGRTRLEIAVWITQPPRIIQECGKNRQRRAGRSIGGYCSLTSGTQIK
jgi:hypothetical protein